VGSDKAGSAARRFVHPKILQIGVRRATEMLVVETDLPSRSSIARSVEVTVMFAVRLAGSVVERKREIGNRGSDSAV